MTRRRFPRFPATAKAPLYLLAGAGVAALALRADSGLLPHFRGPSISASAEKIGLGVEGVVRSSRALYTVHLRSAKRILGLCETNKGFYVKAGQFVSSLRQVPKEYSSILSTLQDKAIPCHFNDIKEVIVKNLGKDLSEIFYSFDEKPIAAASIAQVHHALLRDNQEVAVKVQYPGLRQQLVIDITTMSILSKSVSWIFPEYRLEWMVSEFKRTLSSELGSAERRENSKKLQKEKDCQSSSYILGFDNK